ncbi:MAG: hypothetical protein Q8O64_13615 [Sideroxyarcus sp.]|nr:hypothetical protein [Sideroxyarcus sp.]
MIQATNNIKTMHCLFKRLPASRGSASSWPTAKTFFKVNGTIASSGYQQLTGVTPRTVARDLDGLVENGIAERRGEKRASHYVLKGRK